MLWIVGAILLGLWFIEKVLLHKSGLVHTLLLSAITCFVVQFVQDRRTKAYHREKKGTGS